MMRAAMLAGLMAWTTRADAAPVSCGPLQTPAAERGAFVWVSRLGARAGADGWIPVVPVDAVREAMGNEASLVRLLQVLGRRKSNREPRVPYKVVVLDARIDDLCRPVADATPGTPVSGVAACPAARVPGRTHGCGHTFDADGTASIPVYKVRWVDASSNGFCVLPVARFLGR